MLRVIIGLVVPLVAVVFLLPVVNAVTITVLQIPFLYLWIFGWFVLTSVCLAICWFAFDRERKDI